MGMLAIIKDFFRIKNKQLSTRGKPGSVCFPPDTGRLIHLSAGQ
jgi:hypothetical protein